MRRHFIADPREFTIKLKLLVDPVVKPGKESKDTLGRTPRLQLTMPRAWSVSISVWARTSTLRASVEIRSSGSSGGS